MTLGVDREEGDGRRIGPVISRRITIAMLTGALLPTAIIAGVAIGVILMLAGRAGSAPTTVSELNEAAVALSLVALSVLAAAAAFAYWRAARVSLLITRPLHELQTEAERLARTELPKLVNTLLSTDGSGEVPAVDLIDIDADGEVADLARAFNLLRAATVEVVAFQTLGRSRDLAGVLVNLGRRNQQLIGKQLQLIDRLEATESDPDMLRNLFTLDQMATRMRRNAESLLVLAGERVDRQSKVPQPVDDVLRAATSEVEQYHRVTQLEVEPAMVSPRAVSDLTHLLAELIENATGFSSPESLVRLMGRWEEAGGYTISVIDEGEGMSRRGLGQANSRLSTSTIGGQSATSYLGLFVVGRLAARHHIDARLIGSVPAGTVAKVTLPDRLVSEVKPPVANPATRLDALVAALDETGSWPPAVESTLAPITGQLPAIVVSRPAATMPRPERPPRPAAKVADSKDDLTEVISADVASLDDATVNGGSAEQTDDDASLPIPPFRTRRSRVPQSADTGQDLDESTNLESDSDLGSNRDPDSPAEFDIDLALVDVDELDLPLVVQARQASSHASQHAQETSTHLEVVPEQAHHDVEAVAERAPDFEPDGTSARAELVRARLIGFSAGVAAAHATAAVPAEEVSNAAASNPAGESSPLPAEAAIGAESPAPATMAAPDANADAETEQDAETGQDGEVQIQTDKQTADDGEGFFFCHPLAGAVAGTSTTVEED